VCHEHEVLRMAFGEMNELGRRIAGAVLAGLTLADESSDAPGQRSEGLVESGGDVRDQLAICERSSSQFATNLSRALGTTRRRSG